MTNSEKLDLLLEKVDTVASDVKELKGRVANLESDVKELKGRVANLESEVAELKGDVAYLKDDVADVKLTVENEIRVNIQRVAEGHLDLSRNLHEALKVDNEKEMLVIRVGVLENEFRKIKEKYRA